MLKKVEGANAIVGKSGYLLIGFPEDKPPVVPNETIRQIFTDGIVVPHNLKQTYSNRVVVRLTDPDFKKAVFQIYSKNLNPEEYEYKVLTNSEMENLP